MASSSICQMTLLGTKTEDILLLPHISRPIKFVSEMKPLTFCKNLQNWHLISLQLSHNPQTQSRKPKKTGEFNTMLMFFLCHDFQLVTQAVCTRASSTFTAEMDMAYSLMQETSDLFQAKEGKSSFANKENYKFC